MALVATWFIGVLAPIPMVVMAGFLAIISVIFLVDDRLDLEFGQKLKELAEELGISEERLCTLDERGLYDACRGALVRKAQAVVVFQTNRKEVPHEHWERHENALKWALKNSLRAIVVMGLYSSDEAPWYKEAEERLQENNLLS